MHVIVSCIYLVLPAIGVLLGATLSQTRISLSFPLATHRATNYVNVSDCRLLATVDPRATNAPKKLYMVRERIYSTLFVVSIFKNRSHEYRLQLPGYFRL